MGKLIDVDETMKNLAKANMSRTSNEFENFLLSQPTVEAISLSTIEEIKAEIIDEADFAYADFDRYKEEVLGVESDELPDDDFRYGLERAFEIINRKVKENTNAT